MSRPRKIHKPIKGSFGDILGAVGAGNCGPGRDAARKLAREKAKQKGKNKSDSSP